MESTQNLVTQEFWKSEENQIFLNPRLPEDAQGFYKKIFKEATYRHGLKSHLGFLTSGTTVSDVRSYKVVLISKSAFLDSAAAVNKFFLLSAKDIWLQCLPQFHVGGLAAEARAYVGGFKVLNLKTWEPQVFHETVVSNNVSVSSLVPTQVYDLVFQNLKTPKKFKAFIGGGRLSAELKKKSQDLGWQLTTTYGMTELSSMVATIENEILRPLPHCAIQVIDGKIAVRSTSLFTGYIEVIKGQVELKKPTLTNQYFITDDNGSKLGTGITIMGRGQDMIKVSGELVSLYKLRDVWFSLIGIDLAQVFHLMAMPDERAENQIVLIMKKTESLRDQKVLSHFSPSESMINKIQEFQKQVMPFEKIKNLYVLDQIPRTELGKIQEKVILEKIKTEKIKEVKING
jgi:O-succinylbenzoic acid--CoA ligase